ncbi:Aspartic peptidase [Abeliophyllum distichum]|uniref:Aspartic peptidase n=1 Tax=Abeliophyllum distichum TaxID=126358 RepID=A0ABD1ULF5_9LAMI
MINLFQNNLQFYGKSNENPHGHVSHFLELCSNFSYQGVNNDAIKMRLLPHTLRDGAREWLDSNPASNITSWNDLVQKFNTKYFPPAKVAQLKHDITVFRQLDSESFHEAWEMFKDLLRKCPNHDIQKGRQIAAALSGRTQGTLPSNTETNPKEQVKAITTMSRAQLPEIHVTRHESPKQLVKATVPVNAYIPPIPFPQRLQKSKLDKQFAKFLKIFKKLNINIPFVDAIAQMPSYTKFMKEILSNKRKLEEHETVMLTEECSALLQNKLPPKLKDPGSFTILCTIGNNCFEKALCDLGASINLMTFSVYKKLGLGDAEATTVSLQLADRSIKHPRRIIEDILEHPQEPLEACLVYSISAPTDSKEIEYYVRYLQAHQSYKRKSEFLELGKGPTKLLPSVLQPPTLELKQLPTHLRYAYLGEQTTLPVIIANDLNEIEENKLLRVLRDHKLAIGWSISDIKSISPSICMHKILMKDDYKPTVEHQRRLNPKIQEVVRAEVLKLLDAGIIYPISDSAWINSVQVVPKKGGITVVPNENNELIPTRTVTGW